MQINKLSVLKANAVGAAALMAVGWLCWSSGGVGCAQEQPSPQASPAATAQPAPVVLPPGVEDIVRLVRASIPEETILAKIRSDGASYSLTSDQIIYLSNAGMPQNVIAALLASKPGSPPVAVAAADPPAVSTQPPPLNAGNPPPTAAQPAYPPAAPPAPAYAPAPAPQPVLVAQAAPAPEPVPTGPPPGPEVNFQYFHDQLAPFGTWVNIGGVMYWHPDQALAANPDWRPYYDMGQWIQTDNGLYWQSDYRWGDIPFHYGRWVLLPGRGWFWAPDYTWGPAWVFWRHAEADGAVGWAPLPVGAVFVDGVFMFNGVRVGADFDFGLGESCFTFVSFDHFHEGFFRMRGHEWAWHVHGERFHNFYHRSVVRNDFRRDEHGRFVNHGIGRERMERATRGRIERSSFVERRPVGDRTKLADRRVADRRDTRGGEARDVRGGEGSKGNTAGKGGAGSAGKTSGGTREYAKTPYRPPATATRTTGGTSGGNKSGGGTSGGGGKKR